jgi:hypothetical protein
MNIHGEDISGKIQWNSFNLDAGTAEILILRQFMKIIPSLEVLQKIPPRVSLHQSLWNPYAPCPVLHKLLQLWSLLIHSLLDLSASLVETKDIPETNEKVPDDPEPAAEGDI